MESISFRGTWPTFMPTGFLEIILATKLATKGIADVKLCQESEQMKADIDSFHTRAKCIIWIIIWIAHFQLCSLHMREVIAIFELRSLHTREVIAIFELRSVHTREVIAIFELCSVHTRDRIWDLAFQSGRRKSGYPANQTCTELAFHFLCFYTYAARAVYRWNWLEGHLAPPPKSQFRGQGIHTVIIAAWFARCVTEKHLRTVIWNAHFKWRIAM